MKIKQIIKNILFALVIGCTGAPLVAMETMVDEKNLDTIALTQGYGYKYANLRELETLCASIRDNAYTLAVPIFVGIPSGNVQQFLKDLTHLDIASFWKNIITQYFPTTEIQRQILLTKQYPDGFLQMCEILEQRIKDEFNKIITQLQPNFNFNHAFKTQEQNQNIDELIRIIADKKERLMVRSTGKEDTKKLANAGGNESVSNVDPTSKEILSAMRDVVASYFGKKSLIQRLGARDESLFELTPFTPVLIQRMIGEQAQQLPKCGVMFTEEPEGGISILELKNPNGSTKTTGITVIQAAYGHNEGVVNSLIPVDTFYVSSTQYIYPIIRSKTYRMSPAAERTLELKKNEGPLVTNPALNASAILALKKFSDLLERHYQGPMDVEFVINEQEKTIYIVQARPIVHNPNLPKPSYIINPDTIPDDQKLFGSAIGVAGGALRWCAGKASTVVASTIGQTLIMYQNLGAQSAAIQCIIVGEMAPATSHEATTFRSEGKPVVYVKELSTIEQWLENPVTTLIVSPQQGLIINWQGTENSIGELLTTHIATHGWVSYPVPPFISISKNFASGALLTDEMIISLLPKAVDAKQFMQTLTEKEIATPWKDYLHTLKTGTPDEVSIVLATLLYEIRDAIARRSKDVPVDEDTQNRITLLQQYALSIAHQIQANAHYDQTDPNYTKRLLPIRFLESLLYQQPLLTEIVDGYSVVTLVAKELAVEQAIIQELNALGITPDALSVQYLKIRQTAMTPELEQQWTRFIINLAKEKDQETKNRFGHLILNLGKLNMLPIWLHTSFAQTYKPELSANEVAQKLNDEYASQAQFLKILFEKKAIIDALNKEAFGDPKKFATQWNTFKKDLLDYFLSNTDFIASFKHANNFGKLAALNVMQKFVDTFDLSIKAVTGRPKDNVNEIIAHFKTMLDGYAVLFRKWVTLVPPGIIRYGRSSLQDYIDYIDKPLKQSSFSPKDLSVTADFDAAVFTIGSAANLGGGTQGLTTPNTLEDSFTCIHQCLLAILNALNSDIGLKNTQLPLPLKKVVTNFTNRIIAARIGVNFQPGSITLFYNRPLRDHSVQFEFHYKKNAPTVTLITKFFGANEGLRWNKLAYFVWLLNLTTLPKSSVTHLSRNGIKFELYIDPASDTDLLWDTIDNIIKFSNAAEGKYLNIVDVLQNKKYTAQEFKELMQHLEKLYGIIILSNKEIYKLLMSNIANDPTMILDLALRGLTGKYATFEPSADSKTHSLELIKALIKNGHGFEEVLAIVPTIMQTKYLDKQQYAFSFLEYLVEAGYKKAFEMAAHAAGKAILTNHYTIQKNGIKIFEMLFKHDYKPAFAIALQSSSDALQSKAIKKSGSFQPDIQESGLNLLKMLSKYPKDIDIQPSIENLLKDQNTSEDIKKELQIILDEIKTKT